MTKITESDIENFALELLENQGYICLSTEQQERENLADVVLHSRLKTAIDKLNPDIPANAKQLKIQKEKGQSITDLFLKKKIIMTLKSIPLKICATLCCPS